MLKKNFAVATIKGMSLDTIAAIGTGASIAQVAAINERNLREGLTWYIKHVTKPGVVNDISNAFIREIADDTTYAKTDLRNMFRRVRNAGVWDEQRQCVITKVTLTRLLDTDKIADLVHKITEGYAAKIPIDDIGTAWQLRKILEAFSRPDKFHDNDNTGVEELKKLAPRAYRKNRPVQRIFQEFCKAIGVFSREKGSTYQSLYAALAEAMTVRSDDYTLILSIDAGIFETITNPKFDLRDNPQDPDKWLLHSCHALNHDVHFFGSGNSGYARDKVTFVAFIVKNPDNLESWYNRKIRRQLFFYKVGNNALVQSRLYNEHGGVWDEDPDAKAIRNAVQAVISECEGQPNKWQTSDYGSNEFGYDGGMLCLGVADDFQGYADWDEFSDHKGIIKISVRNTQEPSGGFEVGEKSLCFDCGEEIGGYDADQPCYFCEWCATADTCAECGARLRGNGGTWVIDRDENEILVCDRCLKDNYRQCTDCGQYHVKDACTELCDDRWICNACKDARYACRDAR